MLNSKNFCTFYNKKVIYNFFVLQEIENNIAWYTICYILNTSFLLLTYSTNAPKEIFIFLGAFLSISSSI